SRWVAAQEFARENPDEHGEFPFLDAIQAHWDAGELDEAMEEADTLLVRLDAATKLLPTPEAMAKSPICLSAASFNVGHNTSPPGQNSVGQNTNSPHRSAQNSSVPFDHPLPVHASDLPQEGCHVQPGNGSSHGFGLPSGPPHNSSLACPPGLTSFPPPGLSHGYSLGQNFNPLNAPAYEQPLKLPAFELPEFSGEIDAFPQFWDLFATAVHNNTSVPVALKFMYLKTHLKGGSLSPASTSRRRAGSPHTRRVGFADQTQHPSRTNQSSTCVLSPHELTPSDEEQDCQDDDLHSPPAGQHTSNSPSISCSAMYQPSLLTPIPRLMVVHAPTYNYKADADELLTVFLDSGSQYSFIRKSLALRLGLPLYCPQNITTLTFGGHEFTEESARVTLTLWDQHDEPVLIHLWTREVITTVPSVEDLGRLTNITPIRYELSTNESYESITSCYEDLSRTFDQFWDLWHREYLTALAEKNATRSSRRQAAKKLPQVGDVVLIRQENTARSMWPMGLVLELYRSKDGLSRSARLRMGTKNIVERSVNQLVPLEVTAVDADNLERRQTPPAPTRIQPPRAVKQSRSAACTP
ncbi:hypothetical protein ANCCAN_26463, partial [Ancylostoma caninum]